MRILQIVGALLIAGGLFVLIKAPSYSSDKSVFKIGDVEAKVAQEHAIPPWAGGVALAAGVVLISFILVVLFAVTAHLLPANGYVGPSTSVPQWLAHIILPALALSLAVSADVARQLRTSLVEVLEQNYIVGARVRGLPYRRILVRHALRNASGPALTILGNDFPLMLAGAVAAEAVFSLPGLGQLLLESAQTRDIPVVQGLLLVVSSFVIVVNLIVNVTLNWLYRTDDGIGT